MGQNTWQKWLLIFGFCTLLGLLSFSTFCSEDLLEGKEVPYLYYLVNEMTGAYAILVLLPFLLKFIERFPFTIDNWYRRLPLHFAASVIFGLGHTTLMSLSRIWLYPLFGLRPYQVGDIFYRYAMEYQKQIIVYAGVVLFVQSLRAYRERQEKEREASELALRTAELRTRLADARLQALRNQLQPHFLFNTLNMISSLMYEDVGQADRMIARLSHLLRVSLEQADRPKVFLRDELSFLEAYAEIMRCRFPDRIELRTDLDAVPLDVLVPGFLLQPLAENAIKHGGIRQGHPLEIRLTLRKTEGELHIELTDNGTGLVGEGRELKEGHGLWNTRRRLEELYPGRYSLVLGNVPDRGCRVHITFPLELANVAASGSGPGEDRRED